MKIMVVRRLTELTKAILLLIASTAFLAIAVLTLLLILPIRCLYCFVLTGSMWLTWCADGPSALVVYSDSPKWQLHFEERVLPRMPKSTVVLNWSERKRWQWYALPVLVFSYFGGDVEFNPMVIVVKRYRFPRVFRFYRAFVDQKRGNSLALYAIEASLFANLGLKETAETG